MRYFKSHLLYALIIILIVVNAIGMFFPLLRNDDPPLYANIVKNMLLNHDWLNLTFNGQDWLDKPHFPFWVTAVSYLIFGINSFAYIFPGFVFNLIGAWYAYCLARELYNKDVGLITVVIYLSSLHLMISAIDVRAEVFLLGTILPACYYWYKYNNDSKIINLLLGAGFTACALMTKGLFVLITIGSGQIALWIYQRQYKNFIKIKWAVALALSFIFILPELTALYIQFDLHPEKNIFGHTQVSGLKWFFWDSQVGRFFNNGPIVHGGNTSISHYFFFIHTFLWAFLPWTLLFIAVAFDYCKRNSLIRNEKTQSFYYLVGAFLPTFILFSISTFQLDYYINILIPFPAILVASWLVYYRKNFPQATPKVFRVQVWFSVVLVMLVIGLSLFVFLNNAILIIGLTGLFMLILFITFTHQNDLTKAILYPVSAISLLFIFLTLVNGRINILYDTGYQAAHYLNALNNQGVIVDYNVNSLTLSFHSKHPYLRIGEGNLSELKLIKRPYYILLEANRLSKIQSIVYPAKVKVIYTINGTTIDVVMAYLLSRPRLDQMLKHYLLVEVD